MHIFKSRARDKVTFTCTTARKFAHRSAKLTIHHCTDAGPSIFNVRCNGLRNISVQKQFNFCSLNMYLKCEETSPIFEENTSQGPGIEFRILTSSVV